MSTRVGAAPRGMSTSYMMKVSLLGAMAAVIMIVEFAIPIFPAFLQLDLSVLVPLIGSLALGPVAGVLIQLVKNVLHWLLMSSTGGVGELADFIVGSVFVFTAGLFYLRHKTRRGALTGMCLATLAMIAAGALVNYFITIPLFGIVMGWSEAQILEMSRQVIPFIHDRLTLILFAFCPFNLLKGVLLTAITMPLYKRVSPLLKMG